LLVQTKKSAIKNINKFNDFSKPCWEYNGHFLLKLSSHNPYKIYRNYNADKFPKNDEMLNGAPWALVP